MVKTVRATYTAGTLALAEPLPLPEGQTVEVTVTAPPGAERAAEVIRATSGAWADLLDCEAFERSIYERRHHHRAPVQL
jgi:predicted DNA-binding antitoxin AbrB/MazE fold protein